MPDLIVESRGRATNSWMTVADEKLFRVESDSILV